MSADVVDFSKYRQYTPPPAAEPQPLPWPTPSWRRGARLLGSDETSQAEPLAGAEGTHQC